MKKRRSFVLEFSSLLFNIFDMTLKDNKLNFKLMWGVFMVVIYLGMAFLFVFTNLFANISLTFRIIFGVIFFIYGVFRAWTIWKSI